MPVGLLVAVVTVVVLVGFALLIRWRLRVVKEAARLWPRLEAAAAPLGYRPAPAEADAVVDVLRSSSRFRDSRLELPNLLCRQAGVNRRYVAEYRTTTGTSDPSVEKGWLFAVRLDDRRLPRFLLFHPPVKLPKLIVAGIEKLARVRYPGFERVELETVSPTLANGLMCAESRGEGLRVLNADVVDVLGRSAGWDLECTGDWLFADKQTHAKARRGDPSAVMAELAEFEAIADAFER
ncbi:MAG: hypothetical protein C3F15_03425 [Holophagae bacterium]|nr:MAG: hypothetical protein C3F15_03425 [Holophagae bacterium]